MIFFQLQLQLILISLYSFKYILSSFILSDYISSNPSFNSFIYKSNNDNDYIVHDIHLSIDVASFNWILLGQERGCQVKIDYSKNLDGSLSLHGASTRFSTLPKKQYNLLVKTSDKEKHNIVLRNTYRDPAYCREKLVHDVVYNCGGHSVRVSHVNLYINGEYNGLYQAFEDIDKKFIEYSFDNKEVDNVDIWYYIKRTFDISIDTIDDIHKDTSQEEIKKLNYRTDSDEKIKLYDPMYQITNYNNQIHQLFNFNSLVAFFVSRRLLTVVDNIYHNYGLAYDSVTKQLHPLVWDADKALGVSIEGQPIISLDPYSTFLSMDRHILPSSTVIIPGTTYTEDELYKNMSIGFLDDGGILSADSLSQVMDIFSNSLAASAKRDKEKWGRWYCEERMHFDEAIIEMRQVLEISRYDYLEVLKNNFDNLQEGYWSNNYSCEDQYYGKPNYGMIILISFVVIFNLFAFLIPNSINYEIIYEIYKLNYYKFNSSFWNDYYAGCIQRVCCYQYFLNLIVSVFLLVAYLFYAYIDILDSSEILGVPYMSQIQYIWIYFIIIINLGFQIRPNWLRILLWATIVGVSNLYSIIDLIAFSGAGSDSSATNSRGLALSLDNTESPRAFLLYIWFRVSCQVILLLYSLQIPNLSKITTSSWDKEYSQSPKYKHSSLKLGEREGEEEYENDLEEEEEEVDEEEGHTIETKENNNDDDEENDYNIKEKLERKKQIKKKNNNNMTNKSNCKNNSTIEMSIIDTTSNDKSLQQSTVATQSQSANQIYSIVDHNEKISGLIDIHDNVELNNTIEVLNQHKVLTDVDLEVNEHVNDHDQINEHEHEHDFKGEEVDEKRKKSLEYKSKMKKFMAINMFAFVSICFAYVIYLGINGGLKETAGEVAFSTIISVVILLNIRTVYSCGKWFWLYCYGFDTPTLELMFSTREDNVWNLEKISSMKLHYRECTKYLPFANLSTEKKIRTVDGWMKKAAHTYDGLMVFILSATSFAEGEGSPSDTYSYAYTVSLIYMIFYMTTYNSNGSFAWIIYGAKARVMDGFLGRENEIFGYLFDKYMLPISAPLLLWLRSSAGDNVLILMSWYIFMPIIIGDSFAEVVGGTWGTQNIQVWGMGEINKKSWEGTNAMFLSSFGILVLVNIVYGLSWKWYFYAAINCFLATIIELWAYRSTDNVCMMICGVLLGIGFAQIL